jgi:hypothetical protein
MNRSIDRIHLMLAATLDGSIPPCAPTPGSTNEIASLPSPVEDSPNESISCDNFHNGPVPTAIILMLHDAQPSESHSTQ